MVSTSTAMKLSVANSQFQRRPRLAGPASPLVEGKGTDTFRYLVAQIEHVLLLLQIAAGRIESACAELKLSDKSTEVLAVAHSLSGALELQIDGQTYRGPYTSGTKLGPYEILERIGAGGMGEVYRALDSRLNRIVAVKRLTSRHPSRFHQEARAIARLNHPNICILYDVGPDYLVMEYVEGRPFKGPLPLEHVLRIGVHIASAIEAAHLAGVLHRDLKPANILITSSGVVKLLDFGLAKLIAKTNIDTTKTMEGTVVGTAAYMSPEQANGNELDERSDVFSFGALLYEAITGVRVFGRSSTLDTLHAVAREEPRPLGISSDIARVVMRCLRKLPAERFQKHGRGQNGFEAMRRPTSCNGSPPSRPFIRPGKIITATENDGWDTLLGIEMASR